MSDEQERWTDVEQMREDVRRTLSSIFAGGTYSITFAQMEAIEGALVDAVVDRLRGGEGEREGYADIGEYAEYLVKCWHREQMTTDQVVHNLAAYVDAELGMDADALDAPTDGKKTREENKACPECGTVPGGLWYVRGVLADPPVFVCPACENRWPRYAAPDTEGREEESDGE